MFHHEMVLSVKYNGKFVSENPPGEVKLSFESEYSLFIKNKNPRKALIEEILVDGKNVLDGKKLIVGGNSHIELEGFVDSSKNTISNKFRFVKASKSGSGETGPENGTITIIFKREKEKKEIDIVENFKVNYYPERYPIFPKYPTIPSTWFKTYTNCSDIITDTFIGIRPRGTYFCSSSSDKVTDSSGKTTTSYQFSDSKGINYSLVDHSALNDEGKTEKGSASDQSFTLGFIGELEQQSQSMTITIKGIVYDKILNPVYIPEKAFDESKKATAGLFCTECGTECEYDDKFCRKCGKPLKK